LVLGGALLASQGVHANFVNGGFEDSPAMTGWTITSFMNNKPNGLGTNGITTFPPTESSHLNLNSASANNLTMVWSGTDPQTNNVLTVPRTGFGTQSGRVNGPTNSYLTSSIAQTTAMTAGDVDPDGNIHVRFALAPVLENPNHTNREQPYFFVELTNVTKGTVLFTQFNFANQPGVNWQTYNGVQFTDWVTYDVPLPPGQVDVGDQVKMEVFAAGCAQGGHWGYVYVDQAGTAVLPNLVVSASGPASIVLGPNSTITYTYTYTNNTGVATNNSTVNAVLPMTGNNLNTTFNAVNPNGGTCTDPGVGNTGTVSCNFGTLQPGQTGTFTITVNVPATASTTSPTNVVNHGNYSIQATGVPALTGPLVVTNVYAVGVDLNLTKTGAGTGTVSSSPAGINCGTACSTATMTVQPNTPITLTASPTAGHTFTGWGGDCAAAGTATTCTLPMSQTSNVTASFAPMTYPLTVSTTGSGTITSSPGSISCPGASCNETFNQGTLVTLTATPQPGNALTGWTGCASNPTPTTCTVTMDQARNVTATFVPTYVVTPSVVGGTGGGTITPNTPSTVNSGGVLSGNTFTTTAVTADCTVVVTFAVIPANPVPTLSQWALILMAALLALLAAGQLPLRNNRRP
jgi:uncharacterized repeat protein (TIGR02543 family)